MKDLGEARKILGIEMTRNKQKRTLCLSQKTYLRKLIQKFGMTKAKAVSIPFAPHFKLSAAQSPTDKEDQEEMREIPYSSAVGSLMYNMVCTWLDLAHAMSVISRFMANPRKTHWTADSS